MPIDFRVSSVINKKIFVWFFVYIDFYIDHAIEKLVLTIFDINFY